MKSTNLGKMVDEIYDKDKLVKKAEVALRKLKQDRELSKNALLKKLQKQHVDSIKGKRALITVSKTRHATVSNRAKLDKWIRKNRAEDLYTNKISSKAYFDRLNEGIEVPGVKIFEKTNLSVRSVKE